MNANNLSNNDAVWDKAALLQRIGGSEALVTTLANLFLNQAPGLMAELHSALAACDAEAIRQHSHKLKGSAGDLALTQLARVAAKIEGLARVNAPQEAQACESALAAAMEGATSALTQHINTP
ncbi:Hpt domain-containing protein [Alteromonas sp. CYL-A6]|uniref:Hpt domain-containing protein n=1 Tax=Alteromonas nitratireducens TaxID=3390813 RepID=UPI0034B40F97